MAIQITNTNYNGEVLEQLLTLASTGNEIVEKGLVHVEPGIASTFSIPRLKATTMLQKRKEMPTDSDSKGDFKYSERVLAPKDFMAFTTFNPRSFEKIWRKWQPKGPLVFAELPAEAQNALLAELAKQVKFELGDHIINGEYAEMGDDKLFNGFVYRMEHDTDKVSVTSNNTTVVGRLNDLYEAIPDTLVDNADLRIIMSTGDWRKYGSELIAQPYKGIDYSQATPDVFRGVKIERLARWPKGLYVATITGPDLNTNLWVGVNLADDPDVIQIDKLTNAGERYFFKLLMKADTQTAFGEEVVWLDKRESESGAGGGSGSGSGSGLDV
ncbi:MAG: hypothetical protein Q4D10_03510 [Bacteroidales bacterium]|nr:hypothetical protein [Bacteroidales bacterium]